MTKADEAINKMCLLLFKKPSKDCSSAELEKLTRTLKAMKQIGLVK